jgi:toxin-antitoxin system PIN domain toxin
MTNWSILTSFIRISTNRQIFKKPLTINQAITRVQSWIDQSCVRLINPTESHWQIFQITLLEGQAKANLVMDAHIAALAIEHDCILYSTDSDFSRFPKLKWKNPLKI